MVNQLQNIKEQLFDAPREVKESFNNVVEYFGVIGAVKGVFKGIKTNAKIGSLESDREKINKKILKIRDTKLNPAKNDADKAQEEINKLYEERNKINEEIKKLKAQD